MAILRKAQARVSRPAPAESATPATPETDSVVRSSRRSSCGEVESKNTEAIPPLTGRTKARLRQVVLKLTRDCIDWYRNDQDVLNDMSEQELEATVLQFLRLHDYFQSCGQQKGVTSHGEETQAHQQT